MGKADRALPECTHGVTLRGKETILLAEDNPDILSMTKLMLEGQVAQLLLQSNHREAIRLAREHAIEIDLLITDVVMPEMSGLDLVKSLLDLYPNFKHLFTSGFAADIIAHNGVFDERVNIIQKPFGIKNLAAKVREVLD